MRGVIGPAELAELLVLTEPRGGRPATLSFDRDAVAKLVRKWAAKVDQPVVAANLDWQGCDIKIISEGRQGYRLKLVEAAPAFERAARSGQRPEGPAPVVQVPLAETETEVTRANVAQLGIHDRVSAGQTSSAGSIPDCVHNIRLTAQRLNGTSIAPGRLHQPLRPGPQRPAGRDRQLASAGELAAGQATGTARQRSR